MTGDATLGTSVGPASRVSTSLPELVEHVAAEYELGVVDDWSVLDTGYEDCNIDLRARRTRVVVKVFAAGRPAGIAARTAGLITAVRAVGVHHPRLLADAAGSDVHTYDGHRLLVMDFAPGTTFYDLGRPPDQAELARVVEQAARIHACDARPEPVFDSWAIANLVPLAGQVDALLDAEQRRLVAGAIAEMAAVDLPALPITLIHADLTGGNVLLGPDGEITILDFALANRWPRLQELAVIAASLLHGSPAPLPARLDAVARQYDAATRQHPTAAAPMDATTTRQYPTATTPMGATAARTSPAAAPSPLTPAELAALPAFGRAAAAMELLGGLNQWQHGNRGPETDSLITIGTTGLRDYAKIE